MIRIQRQGARFVAADGAGEQAACRFWLRGNTVWLGEPQGGPPPVLDGVFRTCLDHFERRGCLRYGPADAPTAAAFAALGYPVCQAGETGDLTAFFTTCKNCKN